MLDVILLEDGPYLPSVPVHSALGLVLSEGVGWRGYLGYQAVDAEIDAPLLVLRRSDGHGCILNGLPCVDVTYERTWRC
jgi:hypothetical protein